jgi:signal transduction histidine kinase
VAVARSRVARNDYLATLRDGLVLTGALVVLGTSLLAWVVVRRGLAPLSELSRRVAGLDASALDRLPSEGMPEEIQPVVLRLNEALERIEASVGRERQTAANIAHELRTPLAELTTITELAARWPDDAEITTRAVQDGHAIAQHMTRVVSALLKVARVDAGQAELRLEPFDVGTVLDDAWHGVEAQASERGISLDRESLCSSRAHSDREVVEAILASLLKNAVQHAPAGTRVRCWSRDDDDASVVGISNAAPELTPADVERVHAVFWRKDAARTPSEHTGLGLSVAAALAASADIRMTPQLEDGVFCVTLSIPKMTTE